MKVTEKLIEPPRVRLTRGIMLLLALFLDPRAHNRVAITDIYDRLALMVYDNRTIRGLRVRDRVIQLSPETTWKAGLGRTPAFQHRPGTAKIRPERKFRPVADLQPCRRKECHDRRLEASGPCLD